MRRSLPALLLVLAAVTSACDSDRVLAGRRAIATEPAEAIALFQAAEKEKSPCFECRMYLGLAYEKTGKMNEAAAAYEQALVIETAANRPEPVKGRLLVVYRTLFQGSADQATRVELARKAAHLESALKVADPWANTFLHQRYTEEFEGHASAGRHDQAMRAAKAIQGLYLSPEKKKAAAEQATEGMRKAFTVRSRTIFVKQYASAFAEKGLYDVAKSELVLKNRFIIPSTRKDPSMDPKSDGFLARVRGKTCLPLRERLDESVMSLVTGLKIRKPEAKDLDRLFAKMFTYAKAGFEEYGAERKAPAGQVYLCIIRVPLDAFLGELFRFSE